MKRNICIIFLNLLFIHLVAQAPDTTWSRTFGGEFEEEGRCIQQTSDGGYIVTGITLSFGAGDYDIWLIKTDADGNSVWSKTFGGINSDKGYSVLQTSDNGFIILGTTNSSGEGNNDIWMIKQILQVTHYGLKLLADLTQI